MQSFPVAPGIPSWQPIDRELYLQYLDCYRSYLRTYEYVFSAVDTGRPVVADRVGGSAGILGGSGLREVDATEVDVRRGGRHHGGQVASGCESDVGGEFPVDVVGREGSAGVLRRPIREGLYSSPSDSGGEVSQVSGRYGGVCGNKSVRRTRQDSGLRGPRGGVSYGRGLQYERNLRRRKAYANAKARRSSEEVFRMSDGSVVSSPVKSSVSVTPGLAPEASVLSGVSVSTVELPTSYVPVFSPSDRPRSLPLLVSSLGKASSTAALGTCDTGPIRGLDLSLARGSLAVLKKFAAARGVTAGSVKKGKEPVMMPKTKTMQRLENPGGLTDSEHRRALVAATGGSKRIAPIKRTVDFTGRAPGSGLTADERRTVLALQAKYGIKPSRSSALAPRPEFY